jgi:hypothetical protein
MEKLAVKAVNPANSSLVLQLCRIHDKPPVMVLLMLFCILMIF